MYIVVAGGLDVSVGGGAVHVASVYPGEVVGEMACVDPAPRSATVCASRQTDVLELDRTTLQAMIAHAPAVAVAVIGGVIGHLTRRIRETNGRVEQEMERRGVAAPVSPGPGPARGRSPEAPAASSEVVSRVNLRAVPCLKDFTNDQLRMLVKIAPPRRFNAGAILCHEGDVGESCFIIAQGSVHVIRRISGRSRILATLETGAVVGQMALIDRAPRSATVKVATSTFALELRRDAFAQLLSAAHPLGPRFQEQIAIAGIRQLRLATSRFSALTERDRRRRQPAPASTRPVTHGGPSTGVNVRPSASRTARAASPPVAVSRSRSAGVADMPADDEALAYMQTALSEWDLSLADDVSVRRVDGQMTAAEAKARRER